MARTHSNVDHDAAAEQEEQSAQRGRGGLLDPTHTDWDAEERDVVLEVEPMLRSLRAIETCLTSAKCLSC